MSNKIILRVLFASIFCWSFLAPDYAYSQTSSNKFDFDLNPDTEEELLEAATVLMLDGFLCKAEPFIDSLLVRDQSNPNYNYLKGIISLYYHKNHENALSFFSKAITRTEGKLDLLEITTDVTNDVFYHLAEAYHFLNNFDEAERFFNIFIERSKKNSIIYDVAKVHLQQCEVAKGLMKTPLNVEVTAMDETINTEFPEYSPVISANGRELYFTSMRQWDTPDQNDYRNPVDNSYPEDVFFALKDKGKDWSTPEMLPLCTAFKNEASISLSSNMNKLFVYSDSLGNGNVFLSEFVKDEFGSIDDVDYEKLNTKNWETHYVISEDSSIIVFSSERKGGMGGRDLWMMYKMEDNTWSKPINAGDKINTAQEEDSPFLSLDGKVLYYASNGSASMGGFDILKSDRTGEKDWTQGTNLGYPINSTGDDIFYSVTQTGKDAYFSSFRNGGHGDQDIYHIAYPDETNGSNVITLDGGVIDITDEAKEIDLEVTLVNKTSADPINIVVKRRDYFQVLNDCQEYELTYTNKLDGEVLLTETIKTNCNNEPEFLERFYYNGQFYIDGILAEVETKAPIQNASIELMDVKSGDVLANINSSAQGGFESPRFADLLPGDRMNVGIRVSAEGYKPASFSLDTLLGTSGRIAVDYNLEKESVIGKVEEILASYIIHFNYDQSNIRNSEVEIMNKVVAFMNENPDIQIKLRSYTDSRGTEAYNQRLSDRRAQSSLKYIQKRIKHPNRISAAGMGASNPVEDCRSGNCSDEQHQSNRRTTFEIVH